MLDQTYPNTSAAPQMANQANGRAMAQVMCATQFKQRKRIKLERKRNMTSLDMDQPQSLHNLSEGPDQRGRQETPHRAQNHGKLKHKNDKVMQKAGANNLPNHGVELRSKGSNQGQAKPCERSDRLYNN